MTTDSCSFRTVETHVSILVFLGDRVYKLKKPITTPFLDHATVASRRAACDREVALNRRLAPDVYLGVAEVSDPKGLPNEPLVVMRRLPADRRLATLVREGKSLSKEITDVAHRIASFHASLVSTPEIAAFGTRDAISRRWGANFSELERFVDVVLDPRIVENVRRLIARYLGGRETLFEGRISRGFVRDCHGDLLAEDIFCLPDGPRILDGIEFDDSLRYIDVLEDIAFLAMDLERLGGADLAARLLQAYKRYSAEAHPESLLHHYVAYRAVVRAKVACLRYEQGVDAAASEAAELMELALRHSRRSQVSLVLIGGPPGTGKSTLARRLADTTGWMVLRSDEIRKELAGYPGSELVEFSYEGGIYTPAMTDGTYQEMLRRAKQMLHQGESVILDASWSRAPLRERAAETALLADSTFVELRCDAPKHVVDARVAARAAGGSDISDATVAIARRMSQEFDMWPDADRIDTSRSIHAATAAAVAAIAARLESGSRLPSRAW